MSGVEISAAPANSVVIGVNSLLWFYCWNKRVPVEAVAFQFDRVSTHGETWRLLTATFSHVDLMHLAFNMASLLSVGALEAEVR